MSAKDPFSILYKDTNNKIITAAEEKAKRVERYRPGKAPEFQEPEDEAPVAVPKAIKTERLKFPELRTLPDSPGPTIPESPSQKPKSPECKSTSEVSQRPKPVFTSKSQRVTHQVREQQEKEQQQLLDDLKLLQEEKKTRTKVVVAEAILKDEIKELESEPESSSEEDENDFALWKIREVKRIIRDKEIRVQQQKELEEIERRRKLTDWERQEEDKQLGNDESAKPIKQKIQFMQKYYNKGVYYQERDEHGKLKDIFMRDYNQPVEGDHDKTTLPKILQKRRGEFGKKGQSKYTHLSNEDTTNFDPMYMPQAELLIKQQMKGAGYKSMNSFDAKLKRNN